MRAAEPILITVAEADSGQAARASNVLVNLLIQARSEADQPRLRQPTRHLCMRPPSCVSKEMHRFWCCRNYLSMLLTFAIALVVFLAVCIAVVNVVREERAAELEFETMQGIVEYPPRAWNNTRLAIIADTSLTPQTAALYQLIAAEGVHGVIINGDLSETNDPAAWMRMIDSQLGPDVPLFVAPSSRDAMQWSGYQARIRDRFAAQHFNSCIGLLGVTQACSFRGIFIFSFAPGVFTGNARADFNYNSVVDRTLQRFKDFTWKLCAFHSPPTADADGDFDWGIFETCKKHSAILTYGVHRLYARSYLMTSFANRTVASYDKDKIVLASGKSFALNNGLGGQSVSELTDDASWLARWNDATTNAQSSAVFCDFAVNGTCTASCYAKDTDGFVFDRFDIAAGC